MKKVLLSSFVFSAFCGFAQYSETFFASQDAALGYHDNYNTANNNYEAAQQFAAYTIPGYLGGVNSNRATIQFNFSSLSEGAMIDSARLYFFSFSDYAPSSTLHDGHSGNNTSYLKKAVSSWDESDVTWNTQPETTDEDQVIIPQSTDPFQNYILDVTASVQFFIDNPSQNFGYLFGLLNESVGNNMSFHSSDSNESSSRPKLIVYYHMASLAENENAVQVKLYPNPVNDKLYFEGEDIRKIELFDITGKLVHTQEQNASNAEINVSSLNSGIYYARFSTSNSLSGMTRFIKK